MGNWIILTTIIGWIILVASTLSLLVHLDVMKPGTAWRVGLALASLGLLSPLASKIILGRRRQTPSGSSDDAVDRPDEPEPPTHDADTIIEESDNQLQQEPPDDVHDQLHDALKDRLNRGE